MVTEPPSSTDKSVETSESVSASPLQADNQLPPKELRPLKLLLEVASELKTSKLWYFRKAASTHFGRSFSW